MELVVALAIVAILASIAFPTYQEQVREGRRRDAQAALLGFATAMERHFTETNAYTGAAAGGLNAGPPVSTLYPDEAPLDGATKYYDLTIATATATSFALQAAPKGIQAGDRCGTLALGADGGRTPADCWTR
jgi:type IV pilus assembly protein PilE